MNFEPFYEGQKVVCVGGGHPPGYTPPNQRVGYGDEVRPINGKEYTIRTCINEQGEWWVLLKEVVNPVRWYRMGSANVLTETLWRAYWFRPLLENFESISLTKVLEIETPLITAQ